MIRHFCNRCGEIINDGKYATGDMAHVPGPAGKERIVWTVEVQIRHAELDWRLCVLCRDEIIDEAYKAMCANRETAELCAKRPKHISDE